MKALLTCCSEEIYCWSEIVVEFSSPFIAPNGSEPLWMFQSYLRIKISLGSWSWLSDWPGSRGYIMDVTCHFIGHFWISLIQVRHIKRDANSHCHCTSRPALFSNTPQPHSTGIALQINPEEGPEGLHNHQNNCLPLGYIK